MVRALSVSATASAVSVGMSKQFEADYKPALDTFKVETLWEFGYQEYCTSPGNLTT